MSVSTLFNENILLAFQKYAFAQNKEQFINSLPIGPERKIILALSEPYDLNYRDKLFQVGIPSALVNEIVDRKLYEKIQSADTVAQVQDILNDMKKTHLSYFNQPKPNQVRQISQVEVNEGQQSSPNKIPCKITEQKYQNFEQYIVSKIKKDPNSIYQFSEYALRNIPEQILLNMETNHIQFILNKPNVVSLFKQDLAGKLIKMYNTKQLSKNQNINYQLPLKFYYFLPTSHINILTQYIPELKTNSQFLRAWFTSNYERRYPVLLSKNQTLSFSEKQQKRKVLLQAIQIMKNLEKCPSTSMLLKQLQVQLLTVDLALQDPSIKRFQSYLSTTNQIIGLMRQSWQNQLRNLGLINYCPKMLNRLPSFNLNINSFWQEYIIAIFNKHDTSQFKQIDKSLLRYIDQNRYKRLKAKCLLAKGEQDTQKMVSDSQKLAIRQNRQLTICKNNRNSFKVDEQVVIKIKIKNVNKIVVKVYELNLQKHYIENMTQIEQNMQLHFLDPTYQFEYEVSSRNPFKQQIYDMNIKQIKKQRGIFIVDFDGQGISSRAVIRKGAIFCLNRVTLAGVQLKFYDQTGKKVENLKIFLRGQYFLVKQSYLIPFGERDQQLSFIAIVGDYAQILRITVPRQSYKLNVTAYYNKESFVVGGKAKIILNPRLYINSSGLQGQKPISLKLLKNIKVNVETNDYQNIKSIISFENVNWSYQQDYTVQIPIQSYLRNILVSGTCQIKKYNGVNQQLSFSQNITIWDQPGFKDFYLKKIKDNYILHVLGLNGQPLPRTRVLIQVIMNWVDSQVVQYALESDQNGQIDLGTLKYVLKVVIQQNEKQWNIGSLPGTSEILANMNYRQGEKIMIPLPPTNYKISLGTDLNLFYISENINLQNLNSEVKIRDNIIQINGLNSGTYRLSVLSLKSQFKINVYKGKQWQNPSHIFNQQKLTIYQFMRSSNYYLNLANPLIQKQALSKKISIPIIKPEGVQINQTVKAHILAYSFIPNKTAQTTIIPLPNLDVRAQKIKAKGNSYLSNKKLSEQAAYILNRKNQKQFVGNNQQKPHILLNTIKVRDTVQKQQQMRQQDPFKQTRTNTMGDLLDADFTNANYNMSSQMASVQRFLPNPSQINFNSHNNFLKNSGLVIQNIKNNIQFKLPHSYSFFSVLLVSNNSCIVRNYNIQQSQISTKQLSHNGLEIEQNSNEAWSMSRQVYNISKGEFKTISRTSKWCAVSLYNIIQFSKTQGIQLDQWVQKWGSYSWERKLQVYNKKACHQLNSYLKHQDSQFFNKIVAPFLKNKINKTFVDLCLLQDEKCEKWISIQYFEQINYFEKILLIQYLVKKQRFMEAENLVKGLQLLQKTNKFNYSNFKQKFQTMLNAQIKPFQSIPPPPPPFMPPPQSYSSSNFAGSGFGASNFGGALFGSAPPPPPPALSMSYAMPMQPNNINMMSQLQSMVRLRGAPAKKAQLFDDQMQDEQLSIEKRQNYVQQFKQVQKTQQFAQVMYSEVKNKNEINKNFIPKNKFWVDLALFLIRAKQNCNFSQFQFTSQSILYLSDKRSFTLAASFLPKNLNPDYQISSEGGNFVVTANKPFLLFIKQIKRVPFNPKNGLLINHRFFDQTDRYVFQQDGTQMQKEVDQFIKGKQYSLQTLITNTTANNLQVQLLIDIPQGAIPLGTKQYTQIINQCIGAYSTRSFTRNFYFPNQGQFNFYTANACLGNKVIAKAAARPKIQVKSRRSNKKLQTFLDVIQQGETDDILKYLEVKNIFDEKFFRPYQFLWMLKDKVRFQKIIDILKRRGFYHMEIWRFGFLHDNLDTIKEFMAMSKNKNPLSETLENCIEIFEYYPYYSSRVHKYSNENKSKIRNVQFKQTYYKFLFEQIAYFKGSQKPHFKLAFSYFLLLQDRIDQACVLVKNMTQEQKNNHKLQFDYLQCFLDMYEGYPNFNKARKISSQYTEYPIAKWRNYFNQIQSTLRDYDNAVYTQNQDEQKKLQYRTSVINEGANLRISIPADHRVQIFIYSINLELLFSQNPFKQIKLASSIKPGKIVVFQAGQSRQQKLKRQQSYKDTIVEVFESGKSIFSRKVTSLLWINPNLKVKINQKKGCLQVFYQNKPISGCYCKVYSKGAKGQKFYRDGYSDITGTFKYALSELKDITQFSVLSVCEYGGIINKMAPPSSSGQIAQN